MAATGKMIAIALLVALVHLGFIAVLVFNVLRAPVGAESADSGFVAEAGKSARVDGAAVSPGVSVPVAG